jgi:hypothetical protein
MQGKQAHTWPDTNNERTGGNRGVNEHGAAWEILA